MVLLLLLLGAALLVALSFKVRKAGPASCRARAPQLRLPDLQGPCQPRRHAPPHQTNTLTVSHTPTALWSCRPRAWIGISAKLLYRHPACLPASGRILQRQGSAVNIVKKVK